ncbi:isochorismatase family protein [Aestuariibacter sp. GS-14]|nr:isochorismatase family protein [Aestuariibacter sp. GS-14]
MSLQSTPVQIGKRPALILVDLVKGFTDPACPLGCDCPDVIAANQKLLASFRAKSLPVIFTTVVYHNEAQASVFRAKLPDLNVLTPDSEWIQVDHRLSPLPTEKVIEKRWASSFFGTSLTEDLKTMEADSLVVTGLTTSGCVRATAIDGLQSNYPVIIPEEAVGDRNQAAHQANLHDLNLKYASVVPLDKLLSQLS